MQATVVGGPGELTVLGSLRAVHTDAVADVDVEVAVETPGATFDLARRVQTAHTGADGSFRATFARIAGGAADPAVRVEARFAGSPRFGLAALDIVSDLDKPEASVAVVVPRRVLTDAPGVPVGVSVRMGDAPWSGVEVQWRIDDQPLLVVRTRGDGGADAVVPVGQFVGLGGHRVEARVAADGSSNGGAAVAHVELVAAVQVELAVQPGKPGAPCGADDWCVEGEVRTVGFRAAPVPNAAVSLHADHQLLGTLVADGDGRFAAVLHADALRRLLAPGAVGLVARGWSPLPHHEVGWSKIAVIDLPPATEVLPALYAALLFALLGGAALRVWWRRRNERALLDQIETSAAGLPIETVRRVGAGGEPSCALRGRVLHGESGRGAAAQLAVRPAGAAKESAPAALVYAPDGAFRIDTLAPGRWQLDVRVDDHDDLHIDLALPHDGTYDGCDLLPRSCRALVRGAFSAAVRRASGRPVDWSRETPREAAPRWTVALRRGHGEVRAAVHAIERALYGRAAARPSATAAQEALARVDEAQP